MNLLYKIWDILIKLLSMWMLNINSFSIKNRGWEGEKGFIQLVIELLSTSIKDLYDKEEIKAKTKEKITKKGQKSCIINIRLRLRV